MNGSRQAGITTVEFAIIGLTTLIVLFAVLEFGRFLFVTNALNEATRRGARLAAVCPMNDPAIARSAAFISAGDSSSTVVTGLTTGNIAIEYLNATGAPTSTFAQVAFVRVRISNFQHVLLIPVFGRTITLEGYPTTLPRESLGVPRAGAAPLAC